MDILGKYEEDRPTIQKPLQRSTYDEYGFFIRLVMRLSGERIKDARQASYVLAIASMVISLISFLFWFGVL